MDLKLYLYREQFLPEEIQNLAKLLLYIGKPVVGGRYVYIKIGKKDWHNLTINLTLVQQYKMKKKITISIFPTKGKSPYI